MANWLPVFLMPNILLNSPVDGEIVTIANCDDPRVMQILSKMPVLAKFVRKFKDPFGVNLSPSMMIIRDDAPKPTMSLDAVSSFRDAVAIFRNAFGSRSLPGLLEQLLYILLRLA